MWNFNKRKANFVKWKSTSKIRFYPMSSNFTIAYLQPVLITSWTVHPRVKIWLPIHESCLVNSVTPYLLLPPLNSFILPHLHKSYYFNNIYKLLHIYAQNILLLRKAKRIWFKKMNETFPFQLHIFTSFCLSNTGSKRCSTMIINQKAISSKINFYNLILDYLICQNRSVLLMVTWIEQ